MTPQAALIMLLMLDDCGFCRGNGIIERHDSLLTCFPCHGTGKHLSDVGVEVLRALGERARHIEAMTKGRRTP